MSEEVEGFIEGSELDEERIHDVMTSIKDCNVHIGTHNDDIILSVLFFCMDRCIMRESNEFTVTINCELTFKHLVTLMDACFEHFGYPIDITKGEHAWQYFSDNGCIILNIKQVSTADLIQISTTSGTFAYNTISGV